MEISSPAHLRLKAGDDRGIRGSNSLLAFSSGNLFLTPKLDRPETLLDPQSVFVSTQTAGMDEHAGDFEGGRAFGAEPFEKE